MSPRHSIVGHLQLVPRRARLGALVQEYSGRLGIDKIEDCESWYSQEHPGPTGALTEAPRIVLVGLGVDDRTRRIGQFLAEKGY